jgi:hypothetical protein
MRGNLTRRSAAMKTLDRFPTAIRIATALLPAIVLSTWHTFFETVARAQEDLPPRTMAEGGPRAFEVVVHPTDPDTK